MTVDCTSFGVGVAPALHPAPLDPVSHPNPHGCSCGLAPEGRPGQAYNEEAFHYFLAVERARSAQSGRPFILLKVDLEAHPGLSASISPAIARKLFLALTHCIGETDFVGWYRHGRVLGATLVELRDASEIDVSHQIRHRVLRILRKCISSAVARRLRVRARSHPAPQRADSGRASRRAALAEGEI